MRKSDAPSSALAAKSLAPGLLATGQGFLNMSIGFSSLGAGIVGGLLWTAASSTAALHYAAVFSVFGFVLFLIASKAPRVRP